MRSSVRKSGWAGRARQGNLKKLEAARHNAGAKIDTELLNAARAMVACEDDFGVWLVTRGDQLPRDFELEF